MFLVTGGAGFIGSHTVEALTAAGHRVRVLDDLSTGKRDRLDAERVELVVGSIEDASAVRRALVGVDRVIHLAARISVPESLQRPRAYHDTNVGGFLQVLEGAREVGVRQVVYASSCAVYGSLPGLPKRETDPLAPESPYAATKLANEAYGRSFATLDLACVGLRYFNVFGPRQDPAGPYGAVIPTFVARALAGRPLRIDGDGEQGRDFVSVRDVARANVAAALADGVAGEVFNVGTGHMLTIRRLAEAVRAEVGDVAVEHADARPGDVRFSCADVTAARDRLGWTAALDFDEALAETIRWFVASARG